MFAQTRKGRSEFGEFLQCLLFIFHYQITQDVCGLNQIILSMAKAITFGHIFSR